MNIYEVEKQTNPAHFTTDLCTCGCGNVTILPHIDCDSRFPFHDGKMFVHCRNNFMFALSLLRRLHLGETIGTVELGKAITRLENVE